jgi:hypothetical protein
VRWALFALLVIGGAALAQSNRYPTGARGASSTTIINLTTTAVVVVGASPYKVAAASNPAVWMSTHALGSGSTTTGGRFYTTIASKVTGARFWWFTQAAPLPTVRCSLWNVDNGARLAQADVAAAFGANICSFATAPTIEPYHRYEITMWATTGSLYSYFTTSSDPQLVPVFPWQGVNFVWLAWSRYKSGAGDGVPDSNATTEKYPIEPTFGPAG